MSIRGTLTQRKSRRRLARRYGPHVGIFVVVAVLYMLGGLNFIEDRLADQKFRTIQHEASGELVVVGIDPKSISQIGTWPWPRGLHGEAITRLFRAGARQLAFDVDFSSLSVPKEDQWLEDSLAMASGNVVLPVFKQVSRTSSGHTYISFTVPHDRFREYAEVGSINIRPDADGIVRQHTVDESWGLRSVPTVPALLAGEAAVNQFGRDRFFIDFGIDPRSVPVISFVDVLAGRFDADMVRGKTVMIGAMAAEIGDHLPVPVYRSLPGVLVSALASESLLQGRAILNIPPAVVLAVALLAAVLLGPRFTSWSWRRGLLGLGGVAVGSLVVSFGVQALWPLTLDIVPLVLVAGLSFSYASLQRIDQQAVAIFFANRAAHYHRSIAKIISENSSDGIMLVRPDGHIESFNRMAEHIFDQKAEFIIGRHIGVIFSGKRFAGEAPSSGVGRWASVPGLHEGIGLRGDGSRFYLEYVAVPLKQTDDDDLEYFIVTVRDITARKNEEHRIRKTNRILEEKVRERTQVLRLAMEHAETARDAAEAADKIKSNFLANMSHELRTPLNAIIGFSDTMLRGFAGELKNDQQKMYISHIHKAADVLMEMIDDLLDMSALQGKDIELNEARLDVSTLVKYVVALSQKRAHDRKVRLVNAMGDDMPILIADDARMKEALSNVLEHAIKKSPAESEVVVRHEWPEGGGLRLLVSDHGPELSADEISTIFSDNGVMDMDASVSRDNHNLDLIAARALIEAHDGTLTINADMELGNTIIMELPKGRIGH